MTIPNGVRIVGGSHRFPSLRLRSWRGHPDRRLVRRRSRGGLELHWVRQDKTVYAAETELGARVTLGRGKRVCIRYKNFASWLRRRQEGIDPVSFRLLKDVGGLVSHGNYDLHNGASGQLRSFGSKGSVRDRSDTEHDRKLHEFDRVSVGLSQLECSWFGQSDTHELARQHTCSLGCPGCGRRGGRDVGRRVSSGHGR